MSKGGSRWPAASHTGNERFTGWHALIWKKFVKPQVPAFRVLSNALHLVKSSLGSLREAGESRFTKEPLAKLETTKLSL